MPVNTNAHLDHGFEVTSGRGRHCWASVQTLSPDGYPAGELCLHFRTPHQMRDLAERLAAEAAAMLAQIAEEDQARFPEVLRNSNGLAVGLAGAEVPF